MPPTRPHEAAVSGRTKTSVGLKHKLATICNSDTILRAISELATGNTTYTSDTGKSYEFNPATKLNSLLVKALMNTGQLMAENTVFLLLTAIIRNFYKFLMGRLGTKAVGLKKCSRIKAFVFKFVSVPAKWIRTARHYELNIYTDNQSYLNPFALADG